jgi:hypothetical protein
MYTVKDYLTDEVVAVVSRKADALAMVRSTLDQRLIYEKTG